MNVFSTALAFSALLAACTAPAPEAAPTPAPAPGADPHADLLAAAGPPAHVVRDIGFLVYDGVNDLDLFGPRYVLGQYLGARAHLIALDTGRVATVMGVEIAPTTTVAQVDSLDVLVVPGGFAGTIAATYDTALHAWIRRVDATTLYTAAVCTGGHILAATGLLEGRGATTNWYRAEEKLARYGARFTDDRWHRDGKYWTSAGVTAGMDMSLALLADLWSEPYAQGVMLDMEYDPDPPFAGGSPEATPPAIYRGMRGMYDAGFAATERALGVRE